MSEEKETSSQAIVQSEKKESNVPVNAFTQLPETFEQAQKYCNYLASSGLVPKNYQGSPQDIFVAISWGQQVGLVNPISALNSIAVINGSPSMWGDGPLALVRRSPLCEFIMEDNEAFAYARDNIPGWEHLKDVDPNSTSICVGKRVGEEPAAREFSVADVNKANLGNVHNKYPKDMRKYKARSRLLDSLFADVTQGVAQAELVKESIEQKGEEANEDFKDGLEDKNSFGAQLKDGLKDPESQADDADFEDIDDDENQESKKNENKEAETPEGQDENDVEAKKEAKDPFVASTIVSDVVKFGKKHLSHKDQKMLTDNLSKQNGKLRESEVEYYQEMIREAKKKKDEEKKKASD